jgi:hypothetical protein
LGRLRGNKPTDAVHRRLRATALTLDELFAAYPRAWFAIDAAGLVRVDEPAGTVVEAPLADAADAVVRLAAAKPINRTQVTFDVAAKMKLGGTAAIVTKLRDGTFLLSQNFTGTSYPLFDRVDLADLAAGRLDDVPPDAADAVADVLASVAAMARRSLTPAERDDVLRLLGRAKDAVRIDVELLLRRIARSSPDLATAMRRSVV